MINKEMVQSRHLKGGLIWTAWSIHRLGLSALYLAGGIPEYALKAYKEGQRSWKLAIQIIFKDDAEVICTS